MAQHRSVVGALGCAGADGYMCVVSNGCSSVTSQIANITLCRGDHNCSGETSVQDVFDYVGDYFGQNLRADTDESGDVTVQDLLSFISAYFGGC